jgi:hypothetical protein
MEYSQPSFDKVSNLNRGTVIRTKITIKNIKRHFKHSNKTNVTEDVDSTTIILEHASNSVNNNFTTYLIIFPKNSCICI